MKKVGIVTLGGSYNYGNRLQAYATTKIYQAFGFEPWCLYQKEKFILSDTIKQWIRFILGKPPIETPKLIEARMSPERMTSFESFNKLIPSIYNVNRKQLTEFDFFSVGSDQVWNPGITHHYEDWFFLKFAAPSKRIALSPSIGLDSLDERQTERLIKGINGFKKLSIRESAGADIIFRSSGRKATVICDPTLVITDDEWRQVACNKFTPTTPYIFTYLLGGIGEEASNALDDIYRRDGIMPIIPLSDREKAKNLRQDLLNLYRLLTMLLMLLLILFTQLFFLLFFRHLLLLCIVTAPVCFLG